MCIYIAFNHPFGFALFIYCEFPFVWGKKRGENLKNFWCLVWFEKKKRTLRNIVSSTVKYSDLHFSHTYFLFSYPIFTQISATILDSQVFLVLMVNAVIGWFPCDFLFLWLGFDLFLFCCFHNVEITIFVFFGIHPQGWPN